MEVKEGTKMVEKEEVKKQYGYFADAHREFVITEPATPFPWIN